MSIVGCRTPVVLIKSGILGHLALAVFREDIPSDCVDVRIRVLWDLSSTECLEHVVGQVLRVGWIESLGGKIASQPGKVLLVQRLPIPRRYSRFSSVP